jgi:hypothetical protein
MPSEAGGLEVGRWSLNVLKDRGAVSYGSRVALALVITHILAAMLELN